jgi:hypothetical protein
MKKGRDVVTTSTAVLATAIQVFLFVSYWSYMNRMRDSGCECALTPSFAAVRQTFQHVVAAYVATFCAMLLLKFVPVEVFLIARVIVGVMSLVLSALVVKWWLDMHKVSCACSESWEKHVWAGISAYHVAVVAVGVVSILLAAI